MEESLLSVYFDSIAAYLLVCLTSIGLVAVLAALICKFTRDFDIPRLWKLALLTTDFAYLFLGVGLICFYIHLKTDIEVFCKITGFFIQFGIFEVVCAYFTIGVILLGIYNPGTANKLSSFHRNVFFLLFVPQQVLSLLLSLLPTLPIDYFGDTSEQNIPCYKISPPGRSGDEYGIFVWLITWISIIIAIVTVIIGLLKHCKSLNNRIHSVSSNVWQAHVLKQGKVIQVLLLIENVVTIVVLLLCSGSVYTGDNSKIKIFYISLCLGLTFHSIGSVLITIMWTSCCCRKSTAVDETHRKLKRLDLVRIDAPGKIRLRALWNISKGSVKRGLMKVYGPNHLKAWAQEIVVLGTLRKVQHPSLLQCLWTSSSNPYYETMTLITGEVVSSDSRIICLELTNSGTLEDFLHRLDVPLPETCQRMVVHDIAEGLAHLHDEGILHSNLTTASIYLKGSLPNMVMRAAIGDFEFSQIFGAMHQNSDNIFVDKQQFFIPDIRSFALIALEIVSKMCEKTFVNMQYDWDIEDEVELLQLKNGTINNIMQQNYDSDTDDGFSNRKVQHKPNKKKGIMSPAEVIEEIGRRSRSMSPGSRPLSAHSTKSRSRTISPAANKSKQHVKLLNASKYNARVGTPDSHVILPDDEYPNDVHIPASPRKQLSSKKPLPSQYSKSEKFSTRSEGERHKTSLMSKDNSGNFVIEAFAPEDQKSRSKSLKKVDSKKWLNKSTSFLKTLTGSETSVSVFKPNKASKEDSAEEISDEEIETRQMVQNSQCKGGDFSMRHHILHKTNSRQSDQWSIPSDMEYRQNGLKNTVSADSRSSMWSNLPLPLEMIDIEGGGEMNQFQQMIECLPGMADPLDFSRHTPSLQELMEARMTLSSEKNEYWRHDLPGPSQFELIDYYDELQGKYFKKLAPKGFRRTMSGSQILPASVHRTYSGTQVLRKTNSGLHEILEQAESLASEEDEPTNENIKLKFHNKQNGKKLKPKFLREENTQKTQVDNIMDMKDTQKPSKRKSRSKSMKELSMKERKIPEKIIDPEEAAQNRAKARKALNKALKPKGQASVLTLKSNKKEPRKENNEVKYANIKKLSIKTSNFDVKSGMENEAYIHENALSDSESYYQETNLDYPEVTDIKKIEKIDLKRFHSISSNDSCASSISAGLRIRHNDNSLTSGELTSLSSQADQETDEQNTDVDMASREALLHQRIQLKAKMVDSGFDSESSEISSDRHGSFYHKQKRIQSSTNYGPGFDQVNECLFSKKTISDITSVSIDNNNKHTAETTFCLTGFNSQMNLLNKTLNLENCNVKELQTGIDDGFNEDAKEGIFHPSSGMSRLIEVMSAPDAKNNEYHQHKEHVTTIKVKPRPSPKPEFLKQKANCESGYSNTNKASKRYRELTQKGVPLRVSVIESDSSKVSEKCLDLYPKEQNTVVDNLTDDQKLFDQLDSTGFFQSQKVERPQSAGIFPTGHLSRRDQHLKTKHKHHTKKTKKVPLEEIIKETPEENTLSPIRKSLIYNHQQDDVHLSPLNEDSMLNQPTSSAEDGDGQSSVHCNLQSNSPLPPRSVSPKANIETVVVDAELYIDRIYSNNKLNDKISKPIHLMDPDFDMPLPVDEMGKPLFESEKMKNSLEIKNENSYIEDEYMDIDTSLLSGVNDQHVKMCQLLTHDMHLMKFHDLLPARLQNFKKLKNKLCQGGNLGNIGIQILDVAQKCWLSEQPPSSTDLVLQLLDPVTETEL